MKDNPLRDEEYVGYRIGIEGFSRLEGICARVDIWTAQQDPNRDDPSVSFIERLPPAVQRRSQGWDRKEEVALAQVMERGLHRARGAILLGRVAELDRAEFSVPMQEQFAERSEEYLRGIILQAFKRVYRYNPSQGGRVDYDDIGIALMESLDPHEVEYVLQRLKDDGEIEVSGLGHSPGYRFYKPTAIGLRVADQLSSPELAPGLLVEETVSEIERRLDRHAPDLVRRFGELFLRVVGPGQLTHVDVGEIAQTCDLLLQEFLDLPVVWEGISDQRPARDKTKDRLSVILRARVGSETEEALVTGLGDYLFGWFGPLDKFVNKYRHPLDADLSQRLHAKRLVVYTYLLVGDLIELLDL